MRERLEGGSIRIAVFLPRPTNEWLAEESYQRNKASQAHGGKAVSASSLVRNALDFYKAHPEVVDSFVAVRGNGHHQG